MSKKKEIKEKGKGGRPTKWSQKLQQSFCDDIELGLPIADACALASIHIDTYYDWAARGENGEEPYVFFSEAIKKAHANMKKNCLKAMDRATNGVEGAANWTPAAWKLERRDRLNFGKNDPRADAVINVSIDPKALSDKLKQIEANE